MPLLYTNNTIYNCKSQFQSDIQSEKTIFQSEIIAL